MRFALLLAALVLAACPDEVPNADRGIPCVIDNDCAGGDVCQGGLCGAPHGTGCDGNADCSDGLVCRGRAGARACVASVEGGECGSDADCADGERCSSTIDGVEAECLVSLECALAEPDAGCDDACYGHCLPSRACGDDGDRVVTETCDQGACTGIGDCDVDGDCPDVASCVSGQCVHNGTCASDDECRDREACVGGACARNSACDDEDDCPTNQRCVDDVCARRGTCANDDACAFDETCEQGACTVIGRCDGTSDCPNEPGVACLDGACPRAPCGRDAECDDGMFCNGLEMCDPRVGCRPGAAPTTPGLPACANESCDEQNDRLVLTPVHQRCADSSPCTDDVCDLATGCVNLANTFVPAPGPSDDCQRTVCEGGALKTVNANDETPPQASATDCDRQVCQGGAAVTVDDDTETPPQTSTTDCRHQVCSGGAATSTADDTETPPQASSTDCRADVCSGGAPTTIANDDESPPQASSTDCRTNVCSGGAPTTIANDAEVPVDVGCRDGVCSGGTPTTQPNDGNCSDAFSCTVGTCGVDGACTQTPDDDLCACGSAQVGRCLPDDPRATAGCVCLTPATLSCGLDDGDATKQVFERFELFATAAGAQASSTFTWDIAGVPAGSDPSAHVLGNPTSAAAAFFQATAPLALGQSDYLLRVTLDEPNLPAQSCTVAVRAEAIPDTLEVTMFMADGVDVDVHLIGGADSSRFDMPFHELHTPQLGDDENRDCYWKNCPVCSVSIPGQACVPVTTRLVDFDDDGAALTDAQDPQLDIDNVRGCFASPTGEPSCVPEKITVEQPAAGTYIAWTYLWGPPNTETQGLLSSPESVTVTLEVKCRGTTSTFSRQLSSASSPGVAAPAASALRYGGILGFVTITVPPSGACTVD